MLHNIKIDCPAWIIKIGRLVENTTNPLKLMEFLSQHYCETYNNLFSRKADTEFFREQIKRFNRYWRKEVGECLYNKEMENLCRGYDEDYL